MKMAIRPADLKTILHSKRANLYYLHYCRVLVNGGRVEYVTEQGMQSLYWNIPLANTTAILLGTGTSITQAAMREFARAGVLVGFCGGGGTPLYSGNEVDIAVSWLTPQSEYRPVQYLQQWVSFWFEAPKRLQAAKLFQQVRLALVTKSWTSRQMKQQSFLANTATLSQLMAEKNQQIRDSETHTQLMLHEASMTKALYKMAAQAVDYHGFTRCKRGQGSDTVNQYLDQGNYLAYGLAATAAWVLGLPHGLAVMHGKTRRGGLVFDIADLVKDALILPQAFISAMAGDDEQEFRQQCLTHFQTYGALDLMIDTLQQVAEQLGTEQ